MGLDSSIRHMIDKRNHNLAAIIGHQQQRMKNDPIGHNFGSSTYTLSRVLLNSLLFKNIKEREELQKRSQYTIMDITVIVERDYEVQWILMIGQKLRLGLNTIGLAIAIVDRILRLVKVKGKYVHCLAVTALGLAVKFHEEIDADSEAFETNRHAALLLAIPSPEPVNADELALKIRQNSFFSQQELNRMERTLLSQLSWDLLLPSIDRFLHSMLAVIGAPHLITSNVLRCNFEVIISNGQLIWSYSSPVLALSLLSIMLQLTSTSLEWPRITESLRIIFQIESVDLVKCRKEIAKSFGDWVDAASHLKQVNIRTHLTISRRAKKQRKQQIGGIVRGKTKFRRPLFGAFIEQDDSEEE